MKRFVFLPLNRLIASLFLMLFSPKQVIFMVMCVVSALMFLVLPADAQQFLVRTIYFQPTDAPGPTREIFHLLTENQDFYRDEMERHGYGQKTFAHETDGKGNIGIRIIKGRHRVDHYLDDTYNRVKSELHPGFFTAKEQDNVLVIIVGGIKLLSTGKRAFAGYFTGNKAGGSLLFLVRHSLFRSWHTRSGTLSDYNTRPIQTLL